MSGLSLKPPSWASAIPDEVLMSRVLGSIRSSHSSHSSTSTTSSSASSSATLSPPSSSLPVAAALSTSPDESPVFPTSAPAVVQPPFSQHAGVYLPWTCPLCTFVNRAFPSCVSVFLLLRSSLLTHARAGCGCVCVAYSWSVVSPVSAFARRASRQTPPTRRCPSLRLPPLRKWTGER